MKNPFRRIKDHELAQDESHEWNAALAQLAKEAQQRIILRKARDEAYRAHEASQKAQAKLASLSMGR